MFGSSKKKEAKKFGEIAIEKGLASHHDINKALEKQKEFLDKQKTHRALGAILIENGVLTSEDVKKILEIQDGGLGPMAWFAALFGLSR
jgi:hypothetical protein